MRFTATQLHPHAALRGKRTSLSVILVDTAGERRLSWEGAGQSEAMWSRSEEEKGDADSSTVSYAPFKAL